LNPWRRPWDRSFRAHRPALDYIEPYDPGMFPRDASEKYGIPGEAIVDLASNESPYPPPKPVVEAMARAAAAANRYPDPGYRDLKEALSRYLGQPVDNIAVGNGCAEIIDMVCKVFLDPLDKIAVTSPSYSLYALFGMLRDARIVAIETKEPDFRVDSTAVLSQASDARVTFLCSPNNPTGGTVGGDDLERILEGAEGLVVLDESYAEFAGRSAIPKVREYPNLIVARSMSKFFSLAGMRVGYAVASESIIDDLEKIRLPFGISSVAEAAAVAALSCLPDYERVRDEVLSERSALMKEFSRMDGISPYPSEANFIMARISPEIPDLPEKLCRAGILVRDLRGVPGLCHHCIRITVGTKEENRRLLECLRAIIEAR